MKKPLLHFRQQGKDHLGIDIYYVSNHEGEFLGVINRSRVGKFMHWIFCPQEQTFYTNGCLKEIVEFITTLYKKETQSPRTSETNNENKNPSDNDRNQNPSDKGEGK